MSACISDDLLSSKQIYLQHLKWVKCDPFLSGNPLEGYSLIVPTEVSPMKSGQIYLKMQSLY